MFLKVSEIVSVDLVGELIELGRKRSSKFGFVEHYPFSSSS